eukprot:GILJ01012661.1.p1 GENE.GILJ01012661.1~~GILJ01012661.1.p1  ORF type:complete len:1256 (-),score=229.15 GILJ01012661.1:176-3460(-)
MVPEAESAEYPIISKIKSFRKFKSNFEEFWIKLVDAAKNGPLYDGELLNTVITWTTSVSSSTFRAFRHTSCVAGLALTKALITVALEELGRVETVEKQIAAEQKKSKTSAKTKQLQKQLAASQEHIKDIEENIKALFTGIFVHRYRDTFPEIRAACVTALGEWIMLYPDWFFQDQFLKYIGWTLYDKTAEVRLCTLDALVTIFDNDAFLPKLAPFTQRFSERFVQCSLDIDHQVALRAIELVTIVAKKEMLDDQESEKVVALLWDADGEIRSAAALFVDAAIFQQSIMSPTQTAPAPATSGKRNKVQASRQAEESLLSLLELIESFTDNNILLVEYIVDAFWGKAPVLFDWPCMTELLTRGEDTNSSYSSKSRAATLSDTQKTILCYVLASSVEKCKTDKDSDKKANKKIIEEQESRLEELTVHLTATLPSLLTTFQADPHRIERLVDVCHCLDLPSLATYSRHKTEFKTLCEMLHSIFFKHTQPAIFEGVAKAIRLFTTVEHVGKAEAVTVFSSTEDTLLQNLTSALKAYKPADEDSTNAKSQSRCVAVLLALQRSQALFRELEPKSKRSVFDSPLSLLESRIAGQTVAGDKTCLAAELCQLLLLWEVKEIVSLPAGDKKAVELLKELQHHRDQLLECLSSLLSDEDTVVASKSFALISDLLCTFTGTTGGPHAAHLAYAVSEDLVALLVCHVQSVDGSAQDLQSKGKGFTVKRRADAKKKFDEDESRDPFYETLVATARMVVFHPDLRRSSLCSVVLLHLSSADSKPIQDLVRGCLTKLKALALHTSSPAQFYSEVQVQALQRVFESDSDDNLVKLKDLAEKFARAQGVANLPSKLRGLLADLIRKGIDYALLGGETRFTFLESGISPFVNKSFVLPSECIGLLQHLRDAMAAIKMDPETLEEADNQPLAAFERALAKHAGAKPLLTDTGRATPQRSKARRSRSAEDESENELEGKQSEEEEDEPLELKRRPVRRAASRQSSQQNSSFSQEAAQKAVDRRSSRRVGMHLKLDLSDEDEEEEEGSSQQPSMTAAKTTARKRSRQDSQGATGSSSTISKTRSSVRRDSSVTVDIHSGLADREYSPVKRSVQPGV